MKLLPGLILLCLLASGFSVSAETDETFQAVTDCIQLDVNLQTEEDLARFKALPNMTPERICDLMKPSVRILMRNSTISVSADWMAAKIDPFRVQMRRKDWPAQHFLEVETTKGTLFYVADGLFGKSGGRKVPLADNVVQQTNSGDLSVQLAETYILFTPEQNRVAITYRNIPLAGVNDFKARIIDSHTFQLRHKNWGKSFWELDTLACQAWKIKSGKFGIKNDNDNISLLLGIYPLKGEVKVPSRPTPSSNIPNRKQAELNRMAQEDLARMREQLASVQQVYTDKQPTQEYPSHEKATASLPYPPPQVSKATPVNWNTPVSRKEDLTDFGFSQQENVTNNNSQPRWPIDRSLIIARYKPRENSAWQEKYKNLYRKTLSGKRANLLLVPVQVDGYAIDRSGRLLMTHFIHQRLQAAGYNLISPTLVSRVLGENNRTFDRQRIYNLAEQLGVKNILIPSAGHNGKQLWNLQFIVLQADDQGRFHDGCPFRQAQRTNLAFSDDLPPSLLFPEKLDPLLAEVKITAKSRKSSTGKSTTTPPALPLNPAELFEQEGQSASENAYFLQMAAMLFPRQTPAMEGLFQRSLATAWTLNKKDPKRALLIARALFYLHRRPAALKALGNPTTAEAKAFLALLNGDLISLEKSRKGIQAPLARLMADIEYQDLRWTYTQKPIEEKALEEITADCSAWQPLVARRVLRKWIWQIQPNIYIKDLLDKEFPIDGFSAQSLAMSRLALGLSPFKGTEVELCAYEHFRRILNERGAVLYQSSVSSQLHRRDYLDLLYETSEANLINSVRLSVINRGLDDEGLEKLQNYEKVYAGHPEFTALRARVCKSKAEKSKDVEKEQSIKEFVKLKDLSAFWEQGQSSHSHLFEFTKDFPKRYYWLDERERMTFLENSLQYTNNDFQIVQLLHGYYRAPSRESALKSLMARLKYRFIGHPKRQVLFAEESERAGDLDGAMQCYRESIEMFPNQWLAYWELGGLKIKTGRIEEAFNIFTSYPPFNAESPSDRVTLSNQAYEAARDFYLLGETDKAGSLFATSRDFETGSGAEMSSAALVSLINSSYAEAAYHYQRGARRYQQDIFYAGYLRLLHVMGHHEEAWAVFDNLPAGKKTSVVWDAALYGLRMEGKTDREISTWYQKKNNDGDATDFYLSQLIDRKLGAKLPFRLQNDQQKKNLINIYRDIKTNNYREDHPYSKVSKGEFINHDFLPYLAIYYHETGRHDRFTVLLEEFRTKRGKGFEQHLAEGVLQGLNSQPEDALREFHQAWLQIPFRRNNYLPALYQLSDLCEWLFEKTKDRRYQKASLKYARLKNQQDPTAAWPYALLAKHAESASEGLKALGAILYLDPNSERIRSFSEKEKEQAKRLFEKSNPFTSAPKEEQAEA